MLQITQKVINNINKPNEIIPILLVFEAYPKIKKNNLLIVLIV